MVKGNVYLQRPEWHQEQSNRERHESRIALQMVSQFLFSGDCAGECSDEGKRLPSGIGARNLGN